MLSVPLKIYPQVKTENGTQALLKILLIVTNKISNLEKEVERAEDAFKTVRENGVLFSKRDIDVSAMEIKRKRYDANVHLDLN